MLDEISDFKHKQNGKYEAATGKDDQVNAMMMSLYVLYDLHMRDYFARTDAPATQRIGSLKEMIESNKHSSDDDFVGMVTFRN